MSATRHRHPSSGDEMLQSTSHPLLADEKTTSPDPSWTARRCLLVEVALEQEDLEALRTTSSLPGGFGTDEMRRKAWLVLLRTKQYYPTTSDPGVARTKAHELNSSDLSSDSGASQVGGNVELASPAVAPAQHPDEAQVLLDTKRLPSKGKLEMQADLQDLTVGVLRRFPKLSYFQGYHDIMSVLYLTFVPPPLPTPSPSRSRSRTTSLNQKQRIA
ncbi:MAG: hypothetical protein TREMPRED_001296, partial [Tremellales sp. Tagirdzhanova-0007]